METRDAGFHPVWGTGDGDGDGANTAGYKTAERPRGMVKAVDSIYLCLAVFNRPHSGRCSHR
jgi:hypothetical protein